MAFGGGTWLVREHCAAPTCTAFGGKSFGVSCAGARDLFELGF